MNRNVNEEGLRDFPKVVAKDVAWGFSTNLGLGLQPPAHIVNPVVRLFPGGLVVISQSFII